MRSVYVFLDDNNRPLYAGRSDNFRRRLSEHSKRTEWFGEAASVAWARLPIPESTHRAEQYTLAKLRPPKNGENACNAVQPADGWSPYIRRWIAPWCESIAQCDPLVKRERYGVVELRESNPTRTCDDMLAWLREHTVSRKLYDNGDSCSVHTRTHPGAPVMFHRAPTLHAALEAAVLAVSAAQDEQQQGDDGEHDENGGQHA